MGARASWMIERSFTKKKNFLRLGWLWYSKTIFLFFFETFLFSKSTKNYPPQILKKAVFLKFLKLFQQKNEVKNKMLAQKTAKSSQLYFQKVLVISDCSIYGNKNSFGTQVTTKSDCSFFFKVGNLERH